MTKQRDLILDNDGFFAKEKRYFFSDVTSISFYYERQSTTVNFVFHSVTYHIDSLIYTKASHEPVKIKTRPSAFGVGGDRFGEREAETFIAKLSEIKKRTFDNRAQKYLSQIASDGYFEYDGVKIYKNGEIKGDAWAASFVSDSPWLKRPFSIFIERKSNSFFNRTKELSISTTVDSDVFFVFLSHFFKLSWK